MNKIELPEKMQRCVDEFQDFGDKIMDQYATKNLEGPIFHYTNGKGLMGIVQAQELWLTHYSLLNDPREMLHGEEEIVTYAKNYRKTSNNTHAIEYFWSNFPAAYSTARSELDFFVCSFSMVANDLTQWRSYANNGRGFCLEFNSNFSPLDPSKDKRGRLFHTQLHYDNDALRKSCREVIDKAEQLINFCIPNTTENFSPTDTKFITQMAEEMGSLILYLNGTHKHPCYKSEKEFRLLWMSPLISNPQFRLSSQGNLVSYIKVPLALKEYEKILDRVWIGPTNTTEPETLKKYFHSQGYKKENMPEIRKSELPYRVY